MFREMNETQMEELLHTQVVGRIGCYDGEKVYVVPISYVYEDNCVYAHSMEGLKLSIMRNRPSVCFQVDSTKDLSHWGSVICWGQFEEIRGEEEVKATFKRLNSRRLPHVVSETMHLNHFWPFADASEPTGGVFFRITLHKKTGRYEETPEKYFFAT